MQFISDCEGSTPFRLLRSGETSFPNQLGNSEEGIWPMSSTTAMVNPRKAAEDFSTWNLDPAHSVAEFKVRHMMISNVKGKFSGLSGMLKLDETDYAHSSVEVSIPGRKREHRR